MHPPGAAGKRCVHPEFKSSVHKQTYTLNIWENGAHARCTAFKIMHSAFKSCTRGAGCTLNFKHCMYLNASKTKAMLISPLVQITMRAILASKY